MCFRHTYPSVKRFLAGAARFVERAGLLEKNKINCKVVLPQCHLHWDTEYSSRETYHVRSQTL